MTEYCVDSQLHVLNIKNDNFYVLVLRNVFQTTYVIIWTKSVVEDVIGSCRVVLVVQCFPDLVEG